MQNLYDQTQAGTLNAEVACVVASNSTCFGIERARELGLPVHVLPRKPFDDKHAFSDAVFDACREHAADLVCLAGFLSLLVIPNDYEGRVLNIHPSLLPSFGGKGMHGQHVHQAVIDHGCKVTGCTVHLADNTYDTGPIVVQKCCDVKDNDTAESLAKRVFALECAAYPEAISRVWEALDSKPRQA
jgi:phosphoribosylglycinamide formyltransferase-1